MPFVAKATPWYGSNYFEKDYNYSAYSMGSGRIHIKTLIFAEGTIANFAAQRGRESWWDDYHTPTVWYQQGSGSQNAIFEYKADNYWNKPGAVSGRPENEGWVTIRVYSGTVVITNPYDEDQVVLTADGQWHNVNLRRNGTGDHLTFCEVDWYTPESLSGQTFTVGVNSIYSPRASEMTGDMQESIFELGEFVGDDPDQQPELMDPVFYPSSEIPAGFIAIPYVSYQETYQYSTSLNPGLEYPLHNRSDLIYVPSTDSVQHGFYFYMQTRKSQSSGNVIFKQWLQSNKVNIPAYHRVYNMEVQPYTYLDSASGLWIQDMRARDISWQIKYPYEEDAIESDYFELQRAYNPDFSDAVTIYTTPMEWDIRDSVLYQTYHHIDSTREAWTNPLYPVTNDSAYRVFYRVRRVTSSYWGWAGNPFADSASNEQRVYLQGFRGVGPMAQCSYGADENFANNYRVPLAISLPNYNENGQNSESQPRVIRTFWDSRAKLYLERISLETHDTVTLPIPGDSIEALIRRSTLDPSRGVQENYTLHYTDQVYLPCVHYRYRIYLDTAGATLRFKHEESVSNFTGSANACEVGDGADPYFNHAATLRNLSASQGEYPDCILLTWEANEGEVDQYVIDRRPSSDEVWHTIGTTTIGYWRDETVDPTVGEEWQYRVTMSYLCNGNLTTDSRTATGSRSPWGRVSGRIHYEDGTGCAGITLVATRSSDGATVQTVQTDDAGNYMLDSLPYAAGVEYIIMPTSQSAQFRYNHTSSGSATVNLSLTHCMVTGIDFDNISSVRFSGRVLYKNSTIPVRDANLQLNGVLVSFGSMPVKTDANGNFEIRVPQGEAFTIRVVKEGHTFEGDGFVRINNDSLITLNVALDGVRVWDETKVRLAGRVAGGLEQRDLPLGFGLSHNNLGDNLRIVLELEGDNISHIVHIPSDLTKDTLEFLQPHLVYTEAGVDTVGWTKVHYQLKRIVIEPDSVSGEFCVDLFPVSYKVTQATAQGYASLFPAGAASQTINLTSAAIHTDTNSFNSKFSIQNSQFKITYRSPISITCRQLRWGMELDYFGEEKMRRTNVLNEEIMLPLTTKLPDGSYHYTFDAPVFKSANYDFRVYAHEDYYKNNDPSSTLHDRVAIRSGLLKVYNGLHDSIVTQVLTQELDSLGQAVFSIPVDYASFILTDSNALRVLDLSVESEGQYVESQAVRAYITGNRNPGNVVTTHGNIQLLDVLRDPPGSHSSTYLEDGATYTYNYTFDFNVELGLELGITLGSEANFLLGAYQGTANAGAIGANIHNISTATTETLPVTTSYNYKHQGSYSFSTSQRISTASDVYNVGQDADVYIGLVQNVYSRRWDAVQPVDSMTYFAYGARSANGTMPTVATGVDPSGKHYYLVMGSELESGPYLDATLAYSHYYIKTTVIPQLFNQRDALLLTCDSATAQAAANATGEVVYWSRVPVGDSNWAYTGYYRPLLPTGYTGDWTNRVDHYNNLIANWMKIMAQNEAEKVQAIHTTKRDSIGTYSIGSATTLSHEETYTYDDTYSIYWDLPGGSFSFSDDLVSTWGKAFGKTIWKRVKDVFNTAQLNGVSRKNNAQGRNSSNVRQVVVRSHQSVSTFIIKPIIGGDFNRDPSRSVSHTRKIGYTIDPDEYSHLDVAVYRAHKSIDSSWFNDSSAATRDHVEGSGTEYHNEYLYGSPVFYLAGGATKCPCEVADSTELYEPKMPISAGSLKLENPKIDINVHERSDVPVDRPAVFTITLHNEMEETTGIAAVNPTIFKLKLNDASNPHGARIYIDGMPLTDGRSIVLTGTQIITKTVEVYAGDGYDFDNLEIIFMSTCDVTNMSRAMFSVHFTPVSTPVTLEAPHQNWVLNTLSAEDSVGYYLPVTISDFDVNYRGFDHIELQYKLSTQSDDSWVNLCSFFADSALYSTATGNKAMISGGRINNIHFYGERDPIEQHYDLRAVSFCRHGSGFVSRSSEVMSGIKDTRCPRVFGQPEPAYGILGVADNIKLRFNEPIAGNYLDEDNNFQLVGVTNQSGIASSTSVYFDGTPSCGASSAVTRVLSGKSFSIDLMAKPASTTTENAQELFGHTTPTGGIGFGLEPAGTSMRLYGYIDDYRAHSMPLAPLTDFTRLIMTYDNETRIIRFYAGTQDVTDQDYTHDYEVEDYDGTAPLVFGHGFQGNMLEARLWLKVLSVADIVETHERRLTGYERKLAAYYPMNEGRGEMLQDKASGSTLTMHGASWTTPSGFSLHLNGSQPVGFAPSILSRSAIQDYTLMFWFRTSEYYAALFSAGWNPSENKGTLVSMENGRLTFRNGNAMQRAEGNYADGLWHHYVLTVNRTFNVASIYVDGQMANTFATDSLSGLNGDEMMLGGATGRQTLNGHIDAFALFEQALPKSLVEEFDNISPQGDEMGLIAFLPFSEQKENSNGILEEVFSINNRRIVTQNGLVVNMVQPLIVTPDSAAIAAMADASDHAPARERDLLTKMNFDWSYNNDELLINLNMQDREINKNNVYITVRNVEDLNGNRTVSPTMWQVYVNKNILLWSDNILAATMYETTVNDLELSTDIQNISGRRHQYTIDGLPDWLTVDQAYGSSNPQEIIPVHFTVDHNLAVGIYSEIVYLTDENGLSEPLKIMVEIKAQCPWGEANPNGYERQMTLRGQVMVDGVYDSDPNDIVAAMIGNDIVGMANVDFNGEAGTSYLYMTIYGNDLLQGQSLHFRLWQASTGRIYSLSSSMEVTYQNDSRVGLPPSAPVLLSTSANEVQNMDIEEGWNWISFYLKPDAGNEIGDLLYNATPWNEEDQIKNVATMEFAEWDGEQWMGTLTRLDHKQMYMMRTGSKHYNTLLAGRRLTSETDRTIPLHQGWNVFPYLLGSTENLTNAMADYIEHVSVGDIIKSQTAFAVYSENERWEGSLKALTPGQGYLLHRQAADTVNFTFRASRSSKGMKNEELRMKNEELRPGTNMTVIAAVKGVENGGLLSAYVEGQPIGSAEPMEVNGDMLYFLTLGTDQRGELSFTLEQDGVATQLSTLNSQLSTVPNRHIGTLADPVVLSPLTSQVTAYPIPFTDQVTFFLNEELRMKNEELSVTICDALGRVVLQQEGILNSQFSILNLEELHAGVYFATINNNGTLTTIKLIKK